MLNIGLEEVLDRLSAGLYQVDFFRKEHIIMSNAPVVEWHTRQVEDLCPFGRAGSNPVRGILRHHFPREVVLCLLTCPGSHGIISGDF